MAKKIYDPDDKYDQDKVVSPGGGSYYTPTYTNTGASTSGSNLPSNWDTLKANALAAQNNSPSEGFIYNNPANYKTWQTMAGSNGNLPGYFQMPEYKQYSYTPYENNVGDFSYQDFSYDPFSYQDFSYDYKTDPLYAMYEEQYTNKGQQAMRDTMAQVAARTGGIASSYAQAAAQADYNTYMQELAAKIPELQQIARNMYDTDRNFAFNNYRDARDMAYDQYTANRDFAYNNYLRDYEADYNNWQTQNAINQANVDIYNAMLDSARKASNQSGSTQKTATTSTAKAPATTAATSSNSSSENTNDSPERLLKDMIKNNATEEDINSFLSEAVSERFLTSAEAAELKNKYRLVSAYEGASR